MPVSLLTLQHASVTELQQFTDDELSRAFRHLCARVPTYGGGYDKTLLLGGQAALLLQQRGLPDPFAGRPSQGPPTDRGAHYWRWALTWVAHPLAGIVQQIEGRGSRYVPGAQGGSFERLTLYRLTPPEISHVRSYFDTGEALVQWRYPIHHLAPSYAGLSNASNTPYGSRLETAICHDAVVKPLQLGPRIWYPEGT